MHVLLLLLLCVYSHMDPKQMAPGVQEVRWQLTGIRMS